MTIQELIGRLQACADEYGIGMGRHVVVECGGRLDIKGVVLREFPSVKDAVDRPEVQPVISILV